MGVKNSIYILVLLILISTIAAIPLPDYTLYGSVTVNNNKLTKDDSNIISLTVDGNELVSFTMGEVDVDAYVLRVPLNDEDIADAAQTEDSARIYVDGIEVDPSEVPLLVIKPYNLDVKLTYPPSCLFFDEQSLYMRSSVQSFVSYKKELAKQMVFETAHNVMSRLKIGNCKSHNENQGKLCVDVNKNVQNDIKEKLLGRTYGKRFCPSG